MPHQAAWIMVPDQRDGQFLRHYLQDLPGVSLIYAYITQDLIEIIYTDIVLRTLIFHDIICAEYPPDTLADSVTRFQLDNQRVHLKRLPAEVVLFIKAQERSVLGKFHLQGGLERRVPL